jgi:dTDP-4-dehydrorhamnose 3,5-epimerase-like enzyme
LESNKNIPFEIKRVYYLFATEHGIRRGYHAHKTLQQVVVCVRGKCEVLLDDGSEKKTYLLDGPNIGLFIGSMIWRELYDFSDDCVVLVVTDQFYEEEDYIRDYGEFVRRLSK